MMLLQAVVAHRMKAAASTADADNAVHTSNTCCTNVQSMLQMRYDRACAYCAIDTGLLLLVHRTADQQFSEHIRSIAAAAMVQKASIPRDTQQTC
jgi:hypothetical protein